MSNAVYAALTRQQGLMDEMQVVANNLANSSTTGYKSDRAVFAEFLANTGEDGGLSMGGLAGHAFELQQGALKLTGGQFDLAIQGDGYFTVQTPQGPRLVEELREGDHVQTKDDGAQEIQWIGSRRMTGARLFAMPRLRPIRIRAGAEGAVRTVEIGRASCRERV